MEDTVYWTSHVKSIDCLLHRKRIGGHSSEVLKAFCITKAQAYATGTLQEQAHCYTACTLLCACLIVILIASQVTSTENLVKH